jgi:hypothetical protein
MFYSGAAVLFLVLMFLGFQRFFVGGRAYPDRELAPPIRTLLVVHGVAMTAWVLLFIVQPLLIVGRKHRVHMALGKAGALLAAAIVVLGWQVGVESARVTPPEARIWGFPPRQFMIVPLVSIVTFAVFVAAGVWARRRADVHRPMMMCATLAALPAAVSRIDFLSNLYVGTVWESLFGPFFMTLVLGALLLAVRSFLTRSFDRWLAAGWAGLVLVSALMMQMAPGAAWDGFAGWLLG